MRLDNYMQYTCSTVGCNSKATIQLTLEHYQVLYACGIHERGMLRRYREAKILKLQP